MSQQWPSPNQDLTFSLVKCWTTVAHGTRIAELCANGLVPKTAQGLTTFCEPNGQPTELTCSQKYRPGSVLIDAERLVLAALMSVFSSMDCVEALAYCKSRWQAYVFHPFWLSIQTYLEHSITFPDAVASASLVENPNVRTFVLECWHRLSRRTSLTYANVF